MHTSDFLSIGEVASRTGLAVSAIRFYEERGLVSPSRNSGGRRCFRRADIRRLSFILIAQRLGLTISEISSILSRLPGKRTPTSQDWRKISRAIDRHISDRIAELNRTRELLGGCIGCGCLSMRRCRLYNPDDRAAAKGAGPRFVLGDQWSSVG